MAGTITLGYGTSNQSITLGITTAGTGTYRQSTYVSNATNVYNDVLVTVDITTASSGTSATGYMDVYAYGYTGNGYTANCTGSDASFAGLLTNLVKLGRINVTANSQVEIGGPWSIALAFGGSVPSQWGIVTDNELGSTPSAGTACYQGVTGAYT